VRHALLVMRPIGRQLVPHLIQRLAEPRDIAMPENREHTAEDRHGLAVDHRLLPRQELRQRLRHGEAGCRLCHECSPSAAALAIHPSPGLARAVWQTPNRANPFPPTRGEMDPVLCGILNVHLPPCGGESRSGRRRGRDVWTCKRGVRHVFDPAALIINSPPTHPPARQTASPYPISPARR
jgi:hypothetical protein